MTNTPLSMEDFEVTRAGVTLHVMSTQWSQVAHVIERNPTGEPPIDLRAGPNAAPYDRLDKATVLDRLLADGWEVKQTQQMIVTGRSEGYNHTVVWGICSPDVTVEDVKKRFYHDYFGGRQAWVKDGKFGATIHGTD